MSYIEISFTNLPEETSEILIALLSDLQYEGFEEEPGSLNAFISKSLFNQEEISQLSAKFQVKYSLIELPDVNWNKEWESNFQPVVVENFCAVRAEFHEPVNNVQHEIIITPKMSFGTGHHATTYMMIQQMHGINFKGKHVMDFGTGTGILAILAYKMGAASVTAIDNDSLSIVNAEENFKRNEAENIHLKMADSPAADTVCDIILANVTRNIIQEKFSLFNKYLINHGTLLLSGLLNTDENDILLLASAHNFKVEKKLKNENWICIKLIKN